MSSTLDEKSLRLQRKLEHELGEDILQYLQDPTVVEILLNPSGEILVERFGSPLEVVSTLDEHKALALLNTIATLLGSETNEENPILEGELPFFEARFEGLRPPVVQRVSFAIRKKISRVISLEDYVEQGMINLDQKAALEQALVDAKNMIVVGGTGSGKTTFVNALIESLNQLKPHTRVLVIEDTQEIQSGLRDTVTMRSSENASMRDLVKASLRMRPDRIIIGEVRGGEALDLLKSWNTGHSGGMATIHANSALGSLFRLEQLIAEASSKDMKNLIAEAVHILIYIEKKDGKRSIKEIKRVLGLQNSEYLLEDIVT